MATVIQAKDLSTDVVQVGSVVHVKDEKTGKSVKYTIVGSAEAKPAGEQALQRVAGRARAARAQAQRDRRREGAARPGPQAEDHEDRRRARSRLARRERNRGAARAAGESARHGLPELIAERRAKAQRLRAGRRARFPTRSLASSRSSSPRRLCAPADRRGDRGAPPRRRPHRCAPRRRQGRLSGPRRPQRQDPAARARGRARRARPSSACSRSTSAT